MEESATIAVNWWSASEAIHLPLVRGRRVAEKWKGHMPRMRNNLRSEEIWQTPDDGDVPAKTKGTEETVNAYWYTCRYRPPLSMRLPEGYELVERGTLGNYPLRTDLPEGSTRHGVVRYRRPLSEDEKKSFELEPV